MPSITYYTADGQACTAVASNRSNRQQQLFHVVFADGYENFFFTDVESGQWVEEDLGFTELAAQIGCALKPYCPNPVHVPKLLTWHREAWNGDWIHFGFYDFKKFQYRMFDVFHSNRKYLYTLMELENGEWQVLGHQGLILKRPDANRATKIIQILPQYYVDMDE